VSRHRAAPRGSIEVAPWLAAGRTPRLGRRRKRLTRLSPVPGVGHDAFVAIVADAARGLGGDLY
jgi:hypothetical protein